MKGKKIFPLAIIAAIYLVWRMVFSLSEVSMVNIQGTTMGSIPYSIKYFDEQSRVFKYVIDSILIEFNNSLSTYIPTSEISLFNLNDTVKFQSSFFYPVLIKSKEVYENSKGAFDPTVGPLVNAWGFGAEKIIDIDSSKVDSLLAIIGFDKIKYGEGFVVKKSNMYLDFSAIAKGYGIDVIADFLENKNIKNYMVEIGGEVVCNGNNQYDELWSIGIEQPKITSNNLQPFAIVKLKDMALATSGNYKNYYMKNGQIISHTINPKTGYPVNHNLLSASIFAPNCALADAYATACMVMGLEDSKAMVQKVKGIECVLIYSNKDGGMDTFISNGIKEYVELL